MSYQLTCGVDCDIFNKPIYELISKIDQLNRQYELSLSMKNPVYQKHVVQLDETKWLPTVLTYQRAIGLLVT